MSGIVPQVMPALFAISILGWDINLWKPTVLDLVGAGRTGIILQGAIDTFRWCRWRSLPIVNVGELVSSAFCKMLL